MNTYSRALRHIDMKDVKQKHQQKLIENKIKKEQEKKYLEQLTFKNSPDYSNWRSEISEQMTTADVFYSTLPATGDVNLANPEWNITGGTGYSSSGSSATITNTGSIGPGGVTNGFISRFDTSYYDTLVFDVVITGNSILADPDDVIARSSGTYSISVSQSKSNSLFFLSPALSVGTVTISNLRFQRRTPLNVFVSLDSPEASSFIRTDPIQSNLSPQERRKRLEDMLDAGNEYLLKQLGIQGSTARPADTGNIRSWEQAAQEANEVAQQKYQQDLAAYEKALADDKQKSAELSKAVAAARAVYLKRGQSVTQRQQSYDKLQAAIKAGTDHALSTLRNPIIKPTPPTPPASQPQPKFTSKQLADIDKQIKDLQAQSEKNKRDAANNMNMARLNAVVGGAAGGAALGLLGGAAITAGLGGAALRAGSQVVKTGAGSPGARAFAKANPGKYNPFLSNKVNRYLRNSHEPQGQVISEKKLKSPQEILNKIPGYYDGKPAPLGFPVEPPPEMKNGMHPDLVDGKKVADRFNRLDPISAKAMPITGNPHIDKKVKAARKKPK